jgi:hypothetical protein
MSAEALRPELIGGGHLTGQQIIDGLRLGRKRFYVGAGLQKSQIIVPHEVKHFKSYSSLSTKHCSRGVRINMAV